MPAYFQSYLAKVVVQNQLWNTLLYFTTKAMRIKAVSDIAAGKFEAAFHHFSARCSVPRIIYSDNA